ncbi:MAG TPA: glycogen-binding domain-containing protein [Gemmatimonadales bacterium]|nr:glycogen-binding domain-containing protein [Gemmatimonadales bacterium]
MRLGPVVFFALLAALAPELAAQRQASLGAGTGLVRYAGGTSFSALTLAPAAQIFSASAFLGANGGLSLLEHGVWASQGRADLWSAIAGSATSTRLALSATAGFSTRSDGVAAGSGSAIVEIVRPNFALGAGGVTGVIQQETGVGAWRVRGRAWWQLDGDNPVSLSLTTEATRFLGAWYTDVVGGMSFDGARTVASLWVSGRFSSTYGSTGAASASIQYFLTPRVAIEGSGGNYLRDPFQGLPRAGFLTAGVRVFAARRASMAAATPAAPQLRPLVAQHRSGAGDTVFVRFRMPGAHAVGIAGNWNSWTPAPLRAAGNDIWEAALLLPTGTYYFNLVVDGTDWVVPGGVATISDGMGGMIAVLNVL